MLCSMECSSLDAHRSVESSKCTSRQKHEKCQRLFNLGGRQSRLLRDWIWWPCGLSQWSLRPPSCQEMGVRQSSLFESAPRISPSLQRHDLSSSSCVFSACRPWPVFWFTLPGPGSCQDEMRILRGEYHFWLFWFVLPAPDNAVQSRPTLHVLNPSLHQPFPALYASLRAPSAPYWSTQSYLGSPPLAVSLETLVQFTRPLILFLSLIRSPISGLYDEPVVM